MLPIELQIKQLEKVEKTASTVSRVSITTALVSLVIWVWMQAPGLNFTLPIGGGSVNNINVGYAVIFGPIIVWAMLIWQFITRKKQILVIKSIGWCNESAELGKLDSLRLLISNYSIYKHKYYFDLYWIINRLFRNIFYFVTPGLVTLICFFRLIDFVPMEIGGSSAVIWDISSNPERYVCVESQPNNPYNPCDWDKWTRVKYWLFGVSMSGVQPTMMNKDVEEDKTKGGSFPYIYPYAVWLMALLIIVNALFSWQCFILSSQPIKLHNKAINADA